MSAEDVTLDEVAKKAGVSLASASRALNGKTGVRPEVRERIVLVADALGYRPNRAAKNLAGGATSVIGLLLGREVIIGDIYAVSLIQAVSDAAKANDQGLMLLLDSKEPSEAVRNLLRDGLVDGVIVNTVALGHRWIEELLDATLPTVLIGSHPGRNDVPSIIVESVEASATMANHMFDGGCQRLAFLTGPEKNQDAQRRVEGFRLAHTRRNLPVNEALIFKGDHTRQTAYDMADTILAAEPDGVFCSNDESALGLYTRARQKRIDIPDQLSLAGFDGSASADVGQPKFSTIDQPFEEVGELAVQTLLALIARKKVPLEQVVNPVVSIGDTTRPIEVDSGG